jgi:hypothetical protein
VCLRVGERILRAWGNMGERRPSEKGSSTRAGTTRARAPCQCHMIYAMFLQIRLMAIAFVALGVAFCGVAGAHSGGTDSNGGHYCWTNCASEGEFYGQYHFHGGSGYVAPAPSSQYGDPVYGWRVRSPTGNVQCSYTSGEIACTSKAVGKTAFLSRGGRASILTGVLRTNGGPVLPYGVFWSPDQSDPDFFCYSHRQGMYCTSSNGRYILINKGSVTRGWE